MVSNQPLSRGRRRLSIGQRCVTLSARGEMRDRLVASQCRAALGVVREVPDEGGRARERR
jgi:hypothetical protein